MKIVMLLTTLLLCGTPAFGQGGQEEMGLQQRISVEKLALAEKYENSLQKCRERTRKRAKESCIKQKRNEFGQRFAELEQNPRAYFAAQEQNSLDQKALQERNHRRPSR